MSTTPQTAEALAATLISDPTPSHAAAFIKGLQNGTGHFVVQEDAYFDYKRGYPPNMHDEVYASIVRLTLAFYNSYGGVIIFGVHNELRTAGHNKTTPNVERFSTAIRELTGQSIAITHIALEASTGDVDLFVIEQRSANRSPICLHKNLGVKYKTGTVWLRRGHEVLEAESRDIAFLFSPRQRRSIDSYEPISSYLPPPPATINRFIGGIDVLTALFNWVTSEDEPRKFLWGRGGSGKSTIAYEFARLICQSASNRDP